MISPATSASASAVTSAACLLCAPKSIRCSVEVFPPSAEGRTASGLAAHTERRILLPLQGCCGGCQPTNGPRGCARGIAPSLAARCSSGAAHAGMHLLDALFRRQHGSASSSFNAYDEGCCRVLRLAVQALLETVESRRNGMQVLAGSSLLPVAQPRLSARTASPTSCDTRQAGAAHTACGALHKPAGVAAKQAWNALHHLQRCRNTPHAFT